MKIIKQVTELDNKEPVLSLYSDHASINDALCITLIVTKKFDTVQDADVWWDKYKEGIQESCNILEQALNSN